MTAACPYCLTELEPGGEDVVSCPDCSTPTHRECWDENGGCTVFGCAQAPSDDPKVTVAAGDLEQARPFADTPVVETVSGTSDEVTSVSAPPPPFPDGCPPPPPFPGDRPPPPPFPGAASGTVPLPPLPPGYLVLPPRHNGAPDSPAAVRQEPVPMSVGGALSITARPGGSPTYIYSPPTSRVTFVLLGIFLGSFGVHNFYAGYTKRGAIQLALTCLSVFSLATVIWLWALVEVCVVSRDAEDRPMS